MAHCALRLPSHHGRFWTFPPWSLRSPSLPRADLGRPGPFLGIFCRHKFSSSFISLCTYHASHITPCTSHFTPCTLALHATTPASQAETLVRQEETPAGQEETSASQEETLAGQEEAPANQAGLQPAGKISNRLQLARKRLSQP